ncbi:MAG: hypothetical protein QOE23_2121 [Pseudonocardiales bacterium]|nr:hypothetical protein [Pseudonocardiales bacterium]
MTVPSATEVAPSTPSVEGLPAPVRDALHRVAASVQWRTGQFLVAGEPAGGTIEELADALYLHWYTTAPPADRRETAQGPGWHRQSLVSALRAAHAMSGLSPAPWTVLSAQPSGLLVAAAGGLTRVLRPGDYVAQLRLGVPASPGEPVWVTRRLDSLDPATGFWWTFTEQSPEPPCGRVYLDVRPTMIARVVREVTSVLGTLGLRYQLKCPSRLSACRRVDTMVVYHERDSRDCLIAALLDRWPELGQMLEPAVPPLTCEAAPGLSWADDDGAAPERSFGETRCHALAAALVAADSRWSSATSRQRVWLLAAGLREAGIDPARPWCAPR